MTDNHLEQLSKILKTVDNQINEFYKNLNSCKEEILQAFIAKYGYPPDEVQLVEQQTELGRKFWVEKRNDSLETQNKNAP